MAIKTNTFEGWSNGDNISIAGSGGANGTAFDILVINNTSTPGGGSGIQALSAAAVNGSMGCRMTPAAATTYIRWAETATATRYVMRRSYKHASSPSAATEIMAMRNASAAIGGVRVATDGKPYLIGAADILAAKPASALTNGTTYFIELAVTLETGGGGNGVVAFNITDTSNNVIHTYSATAQSTGTGVVTQYRFGGVTTASGWSADDIDSVAAGDLSSGWIGPLANQAPTGTITGNQNVAAGAAVTATVSASDPDGSIASYAWSVVSAKSTSTPTLTNGTTATVSLTAPAAGNLVTLQCIVTDNGGATLTLTTEVRVPLTGDLTTLGIIGTGASWTNTGGAANVGAAVGDASDTTYAESPDFAASESERRWRFQPISARSTLTITVRELVTATGGTVKLRLYDGNTMRQEWTVTPGTSAADQALAVSSPGAISDWGNLWLAAAVIS